MDKRVYENKINNLGSVVLDRKQIQVTWTS